MKIGILQCDEVDEGWRTEFGNYPAMFESKLSTVEPDFQFVTYRVMDGELPQSVDGCDGYITTGSRFGANDDLPWIGSLEAFVSDLAAAEKKFVGICFGHQILATALGGEVAVSENGWGVGINTHQVKVQKAWMDPTRESLKLVASHQDQVCKLPQGFEVLAGSSFCPYYMLQFGEHMMSIQGHPEFSKAYSSALMDKRAASIPADCIRDGKASLAEDADDLLVMRWIANFFKDGRG